MQALLKKLGFLFSLTFCLQVQAYSLYFPSSNKPLQISLETSWFDSGSNFYQGSYKDLPDKNVFQYMNFIPEIKWAPYEFVSIELFSEALWARSKTQEEEQNKYIQTFQPTHAGLGLGAHHRTSRFYLSLLFKLGAPLNTVSYDMENVLTGDGAFFMQPQLSISYTLIPRLAHIFYDTSMKYRTHGLSMLYYHTLGGIIENRYLDLDFSARFFMPLVFFDQFSNDPQKRWKLTDRVNAGSYKFYSVNPKALSFRGNAKLKPKRFWHLNLYVELDTYGENYARGYTLGFKTDFIISTKSKTAHLNEFQKYRKRKLAKRNEDYLSEESDENSELIEEISKLR